MVKSLRWPRTSLTIDNGTVVPAITPLVVSASRATDIPALFPKWFIDCLEKKWIQWINPFNGKPHYVSFKQTRLIAFWSKNPEPLLPYLNYLEKHSLHFFFQLTINDYEKEGWEPGLPPLATRIATVLKLSQRIGKERLLWRFDPLILTDSLSPQQLLERVEYIGDRINSAVSRLTVSFLSPYVSVVRRMKKHGINPITPSKEAIHIIGNRLSRLAKKWNIEIVTCAEEIDLSDYGIYSGSCIDPVYIERVFSTDATLINFINEARENTLFDTADSLRKKLKDPGQRPLCGCMLSKDIGRYGTCTHECIYCYANNRLLRK